MNEIINVQQKGSGQILSKTQKQFNTLIKKIAKQKEGLGYLSEFIPQFNAKIATKFMPLQKELTAQKALLIKTIHDRLQLDKFNKTERDKLINIIENLCDDMVGHPDYPEITDIYYFYNPEQKEEDEEDALLQKQAAKSFIKEATGIDIDLENLEGEPDEEFMRNIFEKMRAQMEEEEARKANRKKTAKQLAAEVKKAEEEKTLGKSIKEIYMSLVKAFHPDKEQDENEKIRKTGIMQEITAAYEKNDLLSLLELQLKFEQIDQNALNELAEERLNLFIRILKDQAKAVKEEYDGQIMRLRMQYNFSPYMQITPTNLELTLKQDMRNIKAAIKGLKQDMVYFEDKKSTKAYIKDYKLEYDDDEDDMFAMLMEQILKNER